MHDLTKTQTRWMPPQRGIQVLRFCAWMFGLYFAMNCSSVQASFIFESSGPSITSRQSSGIGSPATAAASDTDIWDFFGSIIPGNLFDSQGTENDSRDSFVLSSLAESGMSSGNRRSSSRSFREHFVLPERVDFDQLCDAVSLASLLVHVRAVFLDGLLRPPIFVLSV